jgi:hypothetical protein
MKTAVEWLIEKLQDNFSKQLQDMYESNQLLFEDVFIKAKEMEKQQIFEETSKRIGLMEIELNHTKRLLASCEKALEDRDNKFQGMYGEEEVRELILKFNYDNYNGIHVSEWLDDNLKNKNNER